jgi:acyl dehydratase
VTMPLDAKTVQVGQELPALEKGAITKEMLKIYGPAAGDPNPIHIDEEFAKNSGYPGVFAHGMLSMGFVGQLVTDWAGPAAVRRLGVRFAAIVRLKDVITCRGRVLGTSSQGDVHLVDLEVWAENQKGEKVVSGKATVALPTRA